MGHSPLKGNQADYGYVLRMGNYVALGVQPR